MAKYRKHCAPRASGGQEAFQARMKAQCKAIEQYRDHAMRDEGRQLSLDDAAKEWIGLYAERFARNNEIT